MRIKIFYDNQEFQRILQLCGKITIGGYQKLSDIEWLPQNFEKADYSLFTDIFFDPSLVKHDSSALKIGLLLEPLQIDPILRFKLWRCQRHLDAILTFQDSLLRKKGKFKPYVVGGTLMIAEEKIQLKAKNKLISIVASTKKVTAGHKIRHKILDTFSKEFGIEPWGAGYRSYAEAGEPFRDYRFAIVVENVKQDHFFTEKLIDCLLNKTIPIYWGAESIFSYFDPRGILTFRNLDELRQILKKLDTLDIPEESLEINQELAFNYASKELNIQNAVTNLLPNGLPKKNLTELIRDSKNILIGNQFLESSPTPSTNSEIPGLQKNPDNIILRLIGKLLYYFFQIRELLIFVKFRI